MKAKRGFTKKTRERLIARLVDPVVEAQIDEKCSRNVQFLLGMDILTDRDKKQVENLGESGDAEAIIDFIRYYLTKSYRTESDEALMREYLDQLDEQEEP